MIILYDNLFDKDVAEISASSVSTSTPLTNLGSDLLVDFVKLPSGTQWIQIDCGMAQPADSIAIAPVYTLTLKDKKPLTTLSFNTATLFGSTDGTTWTQITFAVGDGGKCLFTTFPQVSFRYYRIQIASSASMNVGKVFLGLKTVMPGQELSQKISMQANTKRNRSKSGQLFADRTYEAISYAVTFPDMSPDDFTNIMRPLWQAVGNWKTFFVAMWANRLTQSPMIYAAFDMDNADFSQGNITNGYNPTIPTIITEAF